MNSWLRNESAIVAEVEIIYILWAVLININYTKALLLKTEFYVKLKLINQEFPCPKHSRTFKQVQEKFFLNKLWIHCIFRALEFPVSSYKGLTVIDVIKLHMRKFVKCGT